MAMREDCKHFQSRTYDNGDVARMCELDLAPEAPWRCPDDCPAYGRRLVDVNWSHGSLVTPPPEEEPEGFNADSLALLDEAEDIVNSVAPGLIDDVQRQRDRDESSGFRRLRSRFRRKR